MRDTRTIIEAAFAKAPYPAAPHEIVACPCDECSRLAADLWHHGRAELPTAVIERHFSDLPLLSSKAIAYYLPRWMVYALDNPESEVMDFVVYHLSPDRKTQFELGAYRAARFKAFDDEQRMAISTFIADIMNYQLFTGSERHPWTGRRVLGQEVGIIRLAGVKLARAVNDEL